MLHLRAYSPSRPPTLHFIENWKSSSLAKSEAATSTPLALPRQHRVSHVEAIYYRGRRWLVLVDAHTYTHTRSGFIVMCVVSPYVQSTPPQKSRRKFAGCVRAHPTGSGHDAFFGSAVCVCCLRVQQQQQQNKAAGEEEGKNYIHEKEANWIDGRFVSSVFAPEKHIGGFSRISRGCDVCTFSLSAMCIARNR